MHPEDVKLLIKIARESILSRLEGREYEPEEEIKKKFEEKRGAFVTLLTFPEEELRGCIGFPYPIYPLWKAIILAAKESAFNDPRFLPLKREEFNKIIVEISILSKPELIEVENPKEYLEKIKIGRDGLIVEFGLFSGLLLPQVPVEERWNVEQFLDYTCLKAGLPPKAWLDPRVKVYRFTAEVWKEKEPFGDVEKIL